MNAPALHYERYQSGSRSEWLLRIGAADDTPILFIPPLFEEMNRTRALIVMVMRSLAGRGLGCWLPDLGGTGESESDLRAISWNDWRHDVYAAAVHVVTMAGVPPVIVTLRGGALIDDAAEARGWLRFAPVTGASIVRDMERAAKAGGAEFAGYPASDALRAAIGQAEPQAVQPHLTVRLASDPAQADKRLDGPALWRRSEPGRADGLAEALAADIADWSLRCGV